MGADVEHTGEAGCPCESCAHSRAAYHHGRSRFVSAIPIPTGDRYGGVHVYALDRTGQFWMGYQDAPGSSTFTWQKVNHPEERQR